MRKSEKWSLLVVSDSATGWTVAYQAPLSMGFSRQGYWSGLPFPSLGNLPNPGIKPMSTHIVGRRFTIWVTREACIEMRKGLSWAQRVYMCTSVCTSVHMCACVHTCIHVCLDKDCTEGEEQTKGLFIFSSLYPISSCNLFFIWIPVHAKSLQLCSTLCKLMGCSLPGSSVHGILWARMLEWVAVPSSKRSSQPRNQTYVSYISCIGRWVLYH